MPAMVVEPLWVRLDRLVEELRTRGSTSIAADLDDAVDEVFDLERMLDRALKIEEERE